MTLKQILNNCKTALIVGHMRADGDCIGAGLALKMVLEKMGLSADFVCDSDLPSFDFLPEFEKTNVQRFVSYDAIIAEDCGDKLRMGKYKTMFSSAKVTINIDHHISNNGYADYNFVEPELSSTCEVLFNIINPMNIIDKEIASCLFVGLSTDTGHFLHNTTTQKVFLMAAELMKYGIDASLLASEIYQNNTAEKTSLIANALFGIRYFMDGAVGIIVITEKMLNDCNCSMNDTEGIIDYLMKVKKVKIGLCITEQRKNSYKVSIRSKGPDVSLVAIYFGGGGHIRASGFVINGYLQDVIDTITKVINDSGIL